MTTKDMKTKNIRTNKMGRIKVSMKDISKRLKTMERNVGAECTGNVAAETGRLLHSEGIRRMMDFMNARYLFRFNSVMGYTEYRRRGYDGGFMPLEARVMKRMALEARLEGFGVTFNDVRFFLESDLLGAYDPLRGFLDGCRGIWDGKDHIRQLANTVVCDNPHWADWFYRWFLGMVSQWRKLGAARMYGNSIVPLLISRQGFNKSTFCRRLLPPELQWGYCDNMVMTEKRQVLQAMSQFLLVNLDEFNQIPPKIQEGFLKNLLQLPSVKIKRPYGRHVEEMPRLASFIATTNVAEPLSDSTGNRRFIAVELTEPVDVRQPIDYRQLYAQAIAALDNGERGYFNQEETQMIMESNKRFEVKSPMEQCFWSIFRAAGETEEGRYMTTSEIFMEMKSVYGSIFKINSLAVLGKCLSGIPELIRRKTSRGTEYFVVRA